MYLLFSTGVVCDLFDDMAVHLVYEYRVFVTSLENICHALIDGALTGHIGFQLQWVVTHDLHQSCTDKINCKLKMSI